MSDYWTPEKENASKRALELMPDEFFWDICNDCSPIGNDDGADAGADFYNFALANKEPRDYRSFFVGLFERWGLEDGLFDREPDLSGEYGDMQDVMKYNAIVAAPFVELMAFGKVDTELAKLALKALDIQSTPPYLRGWVDQEERLQTLGRSKAVLNAALIK